MKSHRPWTPTQAFLLPPSPTEWLPAGHLAYFVLDVVGTLDLRAIESVLAAKDARGERPYAPRMLLALLLYGYCVGVYSSRKLAQKTHEDVAFRVLAGGAHPHFTTINEFRRVHHEALAGLFVQGLKLAQRAGLVKLGHVSLDGAKILANASKHKAMSHERMTKEEERLRGEVAALLARAEEVDRAEDASFGAGIDPDALPAELARRETRLAAILAAKEALEREAAEARAAQLRDNARELAQKSQDERHAPADRERLATRARKSEEQAKALDGRDDDDASGGGATTADDLPAHRVPANPDGTPKPHAQRNFTDPDSRIMVKGGGYVQAYNAQIAVDEACQIIVAHVLTNQPPDVEHLPALLARTAQNAGRAPECITADSGYLSAENLKTCDDSRVDAHIAPGRVPHGGEATGSRTPAQVRMTAKLQTPEGRALYARRKCTVEPVFGQIEQARGFRRFSLRGLAKVRSEWSFVCLVHNLLKVFRYGDRNLALAAP